MHGTEYGRPDIVARRRGRRLSESRDRQSRDGPGTGGIPADRYGDGADSHMVGGDPVPKRSRSRRANPGAGEIVPALAGETGCDRLENAARIVMAVYGVL